MCDIADVLKNIVIIAEVARIVVGFKLHLILRKKTVINQLEIWPFVLQNHFLSKDLFSPNVTVEKKIVGLDELREKNDGKKQIRHLKKKRWNFIVRKSWAWQIEQKKILQKRLQRRINICICCLINVVNVLLLLLLLLQNCAVIKTVFYPNKFELKIASFVDCFLSN